MLSTTLLNSYLGKPIDDICLNGYINHDDNHCAHFVSHVLNLEFGATCRNLVVSSKRVAEGGTDSTGSEDDDFDHTIAHFVVRQNGDVIRLRTYDVYLNNALALYRVSIEVEGNFASAREIRGDQWQSRRHSMPLKYLREGLWYSISAIS